MSFYSFCGVYETNIVTQGFSYIFKMNCFRNFPKYFGNFNSKVKHGIDLLKYINS